MEEKILKQDSKVNKKGRGIGINNEGSLHLAIKALYSESPDEVECWVDGYIIDVVKDSLLIEIQTRNFSGIGSKLRELVKSHKVKLVHPVAVEKYILKYSVDGEVISKRKSPKRGSVIDVFDELIRITDIINEDNFTLEVLLIVVEELRCDDGKGSWRRKGVSIKDRKLMEVVGKVEFNDKSDFLVFLPQDLEYPFLNKDLSKNLGISVYKARKITYCLKKIGLIREVGKVGNGLLYDREVVR